MRLQLKTAALLLVVVVWGTLLGGIVYEHLVFLPVYLSALPDSAVLTNGVYGLRNGDFWQTIHPVLIVSLAFALWLNRKSKPQRSLLGASAAVYALALAATFLYFVPELMQFQNSLNLTDVSSAEWFARGQRWQRLSYVRGAALYAGFLPLLVALTRSNDTLNSSDESPFRRDFVGQ